MKWVIALHVLAIISWCAGLFYLPRLFVYHSMCEDRLGYNRFITMETKLFNFIIVPSAMVSLLTGLCLLYIYGWAFKPNILWLHIKLICVAALLVYTVFCWRHIQCFICKVNTKNHVFFRWFNEIPTLLITVIVVMVIVQPF